MNQTETADLLERVRKQHQLGAITPEGGTICTCDHGADDSQDRARHVAEMQAAALAEAAEGTISISTEGLPSREELIEAAEWRHLGANFRTLSRRVAEAMSEPAPPLPTAPWSVVTDREGGVWVLHEDGQWRDGIRFPGTPGDLIAQYGPITVRHDAGADQ